MFTCGFDIVEFGEIPKIGKQAEQAGKLAGNWNIKYSTKILYFSVMFTELHNVFLSLSKYVIMYFQACDVNNSFPHWATEIQYTVFLVRLICHPAQPGCSSCEFCQTQLIQWRKLEFCNTRQCSSLSSFTWD